MSRTFEKEGFAVYSKLTVILCLAIAFMTVFELSKSFLLGDIALWKSHVITIIFNSLIAMLASFFVMKRFREDKERFRNLVEITSDWVWEVDERGRYTYASPKVRDLLGYEPEEVLNKTPFYLMPPEEANRVREIFVTAMSRHEPLTSIENTNLHKGIESFLLDV